MLKIDFGSGYNPKIGFLSCDFTGSPATDLYVKDFVIYDKDGNEIGKNSVDEFYCRNVIHHIENLNDLSMMFHKYLKENGKVTIIDCRKEFYKQNVFLDKLWYRYVIPRSEIWISEKYRNVDSMFISQGFKIFKKYYKKEKECIIFCK